MRTYVLLFAIVTVAALASCGGDTPRRSTPSTPSGETSEVQTSNDVGVSSDSGSITSEDGGRTEVVEADAGSQDTSPSEVGEGKQCLGGTCNCANPEASEGEPCDDPCGNERVVQCYAWTCEEPYQSVKADNSFKVKVEGKHCKMTSSHGTYPHEGNFSGEYSWYQYDGGSSMSFNAGGQMIECTGKLVKTDGVCSKLTEEQTDVVDVQAGQMYEKKGQAILYV